MRAVELHLMPEDGTFPGVDETFANLDAVTREALVNFDWHSDGTLTLLHRLGGTDIEPLRRALEDHDEVLSYELVTEGTRTYTFVHVTERETLTELLEVVEEYALLLDPPFQLSEKGISVTVAGSDDALQSAFAEVSERIDVDVESTGVYVPDEPEYLDRMTDRQYEALVTAYDQGYYETPRTVSFEEVADELGCAPSTANELLRRAESELVDAVLARRG
jgi:predicted DNA binding protein